MPNAAFWLLAACLPLLCAAADFDGLVAQAREAQRRGDSVGAASFFKQAAALRPEDYWVRTQLAESYARLGRLEEAKAEWAAARKLDPGAQQAYIEQGYAELEAGRTADAEKTFARWIASHPSDPSGYRHMAFYYLKRADFKRAERCFRQGLEHLAGRPAGDEEAMVLRAGLGQTLLELGQNREAEATLRSGLRDAAGPRWRSTFLGALGRLLEREDRDSDAEDFLIRASSSCEDQVFCLGSFADLAEHYARKGKREKALKATERALSYSPLLDAEPPFELDGYAAALVNLGGELGRADLEAQAERSYRLVLGLRKAIAGSPELADADEGLAELCAKSLRTDEAASLLREAAAIARATGDRPRQRRVLDRLRKIDGK